MDNASFSLYEMAVREQEDYRDISYHSDQVIERSPYDGRPNVLADAQDSSNYEQRPKTGAEKMRSTFDQFFTTKARNRSQLHREPSPQLQKPMKGNLPAIKAPCWQEKARLLRMNSLDDEKVENSSKISEKKPIRKGIQKLEEIGKALGLDPKKNILNPKVLEKWINETLLEVERGENKNGPVTSEKKVPLARYGLDRQTLLAYGLAKEKIDRLFRCLFVYSAGFYELVSNIFDHTARKFNLVGSVWKIFWILLEYCYKADHQTILEEVQLENKDVIEGLRKNLEAKSKEVEALELWQTDTLVKLQADMANVRMEKDNLYRQKMQLEEEMRINDKVYSEEVQLRIKFETKMNEVYAVAKDLKMKHQRTIDELLSLQKERDEDQKLISQLNADIKSLTEKNFDAAHKIKSHVEKISSKEKVIEELRSNAKELENKLTSAMEENGLIDNRKLEAENDELKLTIESIQRVSQNLQLSINEYQEGNKALKSDNERLVSKLEETTLSLQSTRETLHKLERDMLDLQEQLVQLSNEKETFETIKGSQQQRIEKLVSENSTLQYTLEASQQKCKGLEVDYTTVQERIKELTNTGKENDSQLRKDKQQRDELKKELNIRDKAIEEASSQRDLAYEKIEALNAQLIELQQATEELKTEQEKASAENTTKTEHLAGVIEKERKAKDEWAEKFKTLQLENAKANQQVLEIQNKFHAEQQSNFTLTTRLEQTKESNDHAEGRARDHRSQFTELSAHHSSLQREYATLQEDHKMYTEFKDKELIELREMYERKLKLTEKGIHPMFVEDLWSLTAETQAKEKLLDYRLRKSQIHIDDLEKEIRLLRENIEVMKKDLDKALAERNRVRESSKESEYKQYKLHQEVDVLRKQLECYRMETVETQQHLRQIKKVSDFEKEKRLGLEQRLQVLAKDYEKLYKAYKSKPARSVAVSNKMSQRKETRTSSSKQESESHSKALKSQMSYKEQEDREILQEDDLFREGNQDTNVERDSVSSIVLQQAQRRDNLMTENIENDDKRVRTGAHPDSSIELPTLPQPDDQINHYNPERNEHVSIVKGVSRVSNDASPGKASMRPKILRKDQKLKSQGDNSSNSVLAPSLGASYKAPVFANEKLQSIRRNSSFAEADQPGSKSVIDKPMKFNDFLSIATNHVGFLTKFVESDNRDQSKMNSMPQEQTFKPNSSKPKELKKRKTAKSKKSDPEETQAQALGKESLQFGNNQVSQASSRYSHHSSSSSSEIEDRSSKSSSLYSEEGNEYYDVVDNTREKRRSSNHLRSSDSYTDASRLDRLESHPESILKPSLDQEIPRERDNQPPNKADERKASNKLKQQDLQNYQTSPKGFEETKIELRMKVDKGSVPQHTQEDSIGVWEKQKVFELPNAPDKYHFESNKRPLSREYFRKDTVASKGKDQKNSTKEAFLTSFYNVLNESLPLEHQIDVSDKLSLSYDGKEALNFGKGEGLAADSIGVRGRAITGLASRGATRTAVNPIVNDAKPKVAPLYSQEDSRERSADFRKSVRERLSKVEGVPPKQVREATIPRYSGPHNASFSGQGISKTIQITKYKYT